MQHLRRAFTMIELIFVIVVMGILAKFGVEFLVQAYNGYIFSSVQNRLQSQTEIALEQIANRLQYRIKPSIIVRDNDNFANFRPLANAQNNGKETILEWIGYDIDGLRGDGNVTNNKPTWSGFIDLKSSTATTLNSLETNATAITDMIQALSGDTALSIANSALFFVGGNADIQKFGWAGSGIPISDQSFSMHPITSGTGSTLTTPTFVGNDVYEYYQLAWSAYALVWNGGNSNNTNFTPSLDDNTSTSLFGYVLPSPITSGTQNGQWRRISANHYAVKIENKDINFTYIPSDGSFTCNTADAITGAICKRLIN